MQREKWNNIYHDRHKLKRLYIILAIIIILLCVIFVKVNVRIPTTFIVESPGYLFQLSFINEVINDADTIYSIKYEDNAIANFQNGQVFYNWKNDSTLVILSSIPPNFVGTSSTPFKVQIHPLTDYVDFHRRTYKPFPK